MKVDWDAVAQLSEALAVKAAGADAYAWDDPRFWAVEADSQVRSQLLAVGNALNFRFWDRSAAGEVRALGGTLNGEFFTGSMYLWRRIRLAFDAQLPLLDAEVLAQIDDRLFERLFSDDDGHNPLTVGMADRISNLRDLGTQLASHWGGWFSNLVEQAHESLPMFVALSSRFRAFNDPLAKLTLVNAVMHQGSGLARFNQSLLPAIDYQILKQLLRQGILVPDAQLRLKLTENEYLNDAEAMELRYAAMEALLKAGTTAHLPGDVVDNLLWGNRVICRDVEPLCGRCPFQTSCSQRTHIGRPLHVTRFY